MNVLARDAKSVLIVGREATSKGLKFVESPNLGTKLKGSPRIRYVKRNPTESKKRKKESGDSNTDDTNEELTYSSGRLTKKSLQK